MKWNLVNDRPIYIQLVEQITKAILAGEYPPGDKLLSVRELAIQACVNPNTMQKALSELEQTGLIYSQRTSGRYITDDLQLLKKSKEDIAKSCLDGFMEQMHSIGLDKSDVIKLIEEAN